jgi:hypothetical protein
VARLAGDQLPDRAIGAAGLAVALPSLLLAAVFALWGEALTGLFFGQPYAAAGALLGPMALAMTGYGLAVIWLNVYLASRPGPFVGLLLLALAAQIATFSAFPGQLEAILWALAAGGWLPAGGGLLLYLFWLRPRLRRQAKATARLPGEEAGRG